MLVEHGGGGGGGGCWRYDGAYKSRVYNETERHHADCCERVATTQSELAGPIIPHSWRVHHIPKTCNRVRAKHPQAPITVYSPVRTRLTAHRSQKTLK
jgi:hypothetical protein